MGPPLRTGFSRIMLDPLPVPVIDQSIPLDSDQTLTYLAAPFGRELRPPNREGNTNRGWYPWVFGTPVTFSPDWGQSPSEGSLKQGYVQFYDVSGDGLRYILHINPDAVFTDGTPITARQVKKQWEFNAWPTNQHVAGQFLSLVRSIVGIDKVEVGDAPDASGLKVIDDLTLEVTHFRLNRLFALQMASWRFGTYKVEYALQNPDTWMRSPVGAGPYTFHRDPTSGIEELRVSPNYWGEAPKITGIKLPRIRDLQTSYILYENQELDILYADDVRQPQVHDPDHPFFSQLKEVGGAGLWLDAFDTDHPPFDELNVRKAFAHALDMASIVPAIFGPIASPAAGVLTSGSPCNQQPAGFYEFDPEMARQALAASSYGGSENLPTVTIAVSRPQMIRVHEIAQQQWQDNLGVTINLIRLEPGQSAPKVVEIRRTSGSTQVPDGGAEMIHRFGHTTGVSNRFSKFNNPELDAALDRVLTLPLDDPNRCSEFLAVERTILDEYYWLPLNTAANHIYLMQPWVLGWQASWGRFFSTLPHMQIGRRDANLYN